MGMNDSFLAGYLAEKEVRKCSKISLKERSTVYLLNFVPPMDCVAYQVDGNIIKGADKDKCDKLVVATTCTDEKVCVFIELKGSDVAHAVKQLDATLSYPLFAQNRAKWTKARIVANKIPANTGRSVVERAKVDFRRKYNCELICLKSGQPDFLRQDKLK